MVLDSDTLLSLLYILAIEPQAHFEGIGSNHIAQRYRASLKACLYGVNLAMGFERYI